MLRTTSDEAVHDHPAEYRLTGGEHKDLCETATELAASGADPVRPTFHDEATGRYWLLPEQLRLFLAGVRRQRPAAAIIHNLPCGDIPPTPPAWGTATVPIADISLALCGLALGQPFGWQTLQEGRLILDVLPVPGQETAQSGYGSAAGLQLHTEDAFHPRRPDYLLLYCLRNPDTIPTMFASARDVNLSPAIRRTLSEPRYVIFPDPEHIDQLTRADPHHPALAAMLAMRDDPPPVSVLTPLATGGSAIRADLPFMKALGPTAEAALTALAAALAAAQQHPIVPAGSVLIIDNHLALHGRRGFRARYNGADRWLRKLMVTRTQVHGPGRILI